MICVRTEFEFNLTSTASMVVPTVISIFIQVPMLVANVAWFFTEKIRCFEKYQVSFTDTSSVVTRCMWL